MKLQHKAWALVLATVGLLTLMAVWGAGQSVSATFAEMERERAATEGERTRRLLDQQMDSFVATMKDYAYWADTVGFVERGNPGFFAENFTTENMASLRISETLVMDLAGNPIGNVELSDEGALKRMDPNRIQLLRDLAKPVLSDASGDRVVNTYYAEGGSLFLIAIAAVRPDAKTGTAPRGALAMVRRFDQKELVYFSRVVMKPVELHLGAKDHVGADAHLVLLDDARALEHAVIFDQHGSPVAELVLRLDRDLHLEGRTLARSAGIAVALTGLLLGALLVFLLDHLLLRRLQDIHVDLKRITDQGLSGTGLVKVSGQDELSTLAGGLNHLLLRVRSDAAEQKTMHDRQEALQLQLMQSQKTEALGRFTSGIAHDFNNSLAAIGGWVRLADEDLDRDHPSHEALQQALKAARYATGLMRQLLAFSRQSMPRLEDLRICQLIDESRSLVASGLLQTCELVVNCPDSAIWVRADLTQMQQVLVNLMMNAADAMGGSGTIWLAVESKTFPVSADELLPVGTAGLAPGRYVCLTVRDEGAGIAPEHLSRVFDPFFTTKSIGKGTGLGLSVAHGIMARHGGAIGVASDTGAGTTFHVYLPEMVEPPPEVQGLVEQDAIDAQAAHHLLFVDDDQSVRHAWGALLERQGWIVTRARDGEEAWNLFQQSRHGWAVVLTDLAMPKLDGIGLAQRVRTTASPPPVVLMSGNVSVDDAAQLIETDFAAVLHKPVDADELNQVLQSVCRHSNVGPGSVQVVETVAKGLVGAQKGLL
jgi:two-component system, cell cycle sensor histidine kinase and response regulator CckA